MLGQENDGLIFRLRTTQTDLNGLNSQITVPGVLLSGVRQHVVVTYDRSHCRVFVDGMLRADVQGPGGDFSNWDRGYKLLIGNEQTGNRPWVGSLYGIALYNRQVSTSEVAQSYKSGKLTSDRKGIVARFDFSEGGGNVVQDMSGNNPAIALEIPNVFTYKAKSAFLSAERMQRDYMDFIVNFAVFIPFGFLLFVELSRFLGTNLKTITATTLAVVLFPLITESLQYFVPARTSSIYDLGSSIAGGLMGGILAVVLRYPLKAS
jgi:VanZ family protein